MSVKPKRNGSPQLDATFSVPWLEMPPPALAELSLTWVPVTVVLPRGPLLMPPPLPAAELPLTVQLASVVVPAIGPKAASGDNRSLVATKQRSEARTDIDLAPLRQRADFVKLMGGKSP